MGDPYADDTGLGLSKRSDASATPTLGIAKPQKPDPFGPEPLSDMNPLRRGALMVHDVLASALGAPMTPSERAIAVRQREALAQRKLEFEAADAMQADMEKKLTLIQQLPTDAQTAFIDKYGAEYESQQPGLGALFTGISKYRQANAISIHEAIQLDPEVASGYAEKGLEGAISVLGKEDTLKRMGWFGNEKQLPATLNKTVQGLQWLQKNEPEWLEQVQTSGNEFTFGEFEQGNNKLPTELRLSSRELGVAASEPRVYESLGLVPPNYVMENKKLLDQSMIKAQVDERFRVPGIVTLENVETGIPRAFTDRQAAEIVTKEPGKWAEVETQRVGEASTLPATKVSDLMSSLSKIDETETSMLDLERIVNSDPAGTGLTMRVQELAQNTGATARAMSEWLSQMQRQVAMNPVYGDDGKPSTKYTLSYFFDQNIPVAQAISRILPYQLASTFAAQEGRGISDKDVNIFQGLVGTDQLLANPQSVGTSLSYLRQRLPELRGGLAKRMGTAATQDLEGMDIEQLKARARKYPSDRRRIKAFIKKHHPEDYKTIYTPPARR